MKPSSIALFAAIVACSQLIGCATTGSGSAQSPAASDTTTTPESAPAEKKPAAGQAEPECE